MIAKQGRVFIPQEPMRRGSDGRLQRSFDLTPARIYGELVVMLPPNKLPLSAAPVIEELRRHLAHFNDDDYLMAVGAPTLIGWATAIAADSNLGRVNMLVWDRECRAYIEVVAQLWGRRPRSTDPLARKVETDDQEKSDFSAC